MSIRFFQLLVVVLAVAFTTAIAVSPPTPYNSSPLADATTDDGAVTTMAWDCTGWTSWTTIGYGCSTKTVCSNGCPERVEMQRRSQSCTDENGEPFQNYESRNVATGGCCDATGSQCLDPIVAPSLIDSEPTEDTQ